MKKKSSKNGCLKIGGITIGVIFTFSLIMLLIVGGGDNESIEASSIKEEVIEEKANRDSLNKVRIVEIDKEINTIKQLFTSKYDEFEKTT